MPPKKIALWTVTPWTIAPGKLPPHHKIYPKNNCPNSSNFFSKSTMSELRKTMDCLQNHSTKSYFSRLQIKKLFTSMYFLQILTKPWRKPLIRKHLSVNASWFSYARTQKIRFFRKTDSEKKIQKNFIVNNNNKIIRVWYLSSKWPISRFIVNQTNGGASRTKLSNLLKANIFKYCVLFCNRVAKMHLQWRNSFNSNNGQMHFCPFSKLFPF